MALDRDLHVAVTSALAARGQPFERGWEMLAATGVRGLRVLHESRGLRALLSSEGGVSACEILGRNAARYAAEGSRAVRWDARAPVEPGAFDWVDLDPFGSPLPFLDAAVAAARDGALLSVTATDMLVLAGAQAAATRRRYEAEPVRGRLGPEGGLRILLRTIADRAGRSGRSIRPRLAYGRDHYVRAYVTVERGAPRGDASRWIDPAAWDGPPLGSTARLGPMWLGPLFDPDLVDSLRPPPAAAAPNELGPLLERFGEEAGVDVPFYYEPNEIAEMVRAPRPLPVSVYLESLRSAGFAAGRSHTRSAAFRTNAPRSVVFGIGRSGGS